VRFLIGDVRFVQQVVIALVGAIDDTIATLNMLTYSLEGPLILLFEPGNDRSLLRLGQKRT
jgi:hypothetical protein